MKLRRIIPDFSPDSLYLLKLIIAIKVDGKGAIHAISGHIGLKNIGRKPNGLASRGGCQHRTGNPLVHF